MAKQRVSITNNSIKSGVTNDAKKAICEFIWNGFDAQAVHVNIEYQATELGSITHLQIKDDGVGINRSQLNETFGKYQDSVKKQSFQWSSQVKGHRGKGRYAFNCFATRADWTSIYSDGEHLLKHTISINADNNNYFNDHSDSNCNQIVHGENTGTTVSFVNVVLDQSFFESKEFIDYLKREYAVFLELNKNKGKSISINGKKLDYSTIIADTDNKIIQIKDETDNKNYNFELTFIRWQEKIKENYSYYFLDNAQIEHFEKTTSFNRKDIGFHHSVYIISSYFDEFLPTSRKDQNLNEKDLQQEIIFDETKSSKSEKDKVFKKLIKLAGDWLIDKQKIYISEVAGEELWQRFEKNGIVSYPKNEYELPLYLDLKNTVTGIYSVQPKIFENIREQPAKTLVGCLKLLLQTDKREDLISIIESVVNMSDGERHKLKEILKVTEMSYITNTIGLLGNRLKTVSALKAMLFDKTLKAYEVADVQKIVSSAFWLFGEQYNIVTEAEPDFQQALESYLQKLHEEQNGKGKSKLSVDKIKHPDVNKEMDIFAFRQTRNNQTIENIIVELKRPNVKLGELEVSQIKTYMRLILQEPQFNSTNAKWTFILVGNELDGSRYIETEYESNKTWGKRDLVLHLDQNSQKYDIFVKTWSTIFDDFEMRHDFLLSRLNFRREELSAKYNNKEDLHNIVDSAKEL